MHVLVVKIEHLQDITKEKIQEKHTVILMNVAIMVSENGKKMKVLLIGCTVDIVYSLYNLKKHRRVKRRCFLIV